MASSNKARWSPLIVVAVVLAVGLASACGGSSPAGPLLDAGMQEGTDAASQVDAPSFDGASVFDATRSEASADAGATDGGRDGCVPLASYCKSRCGDQLDNCGNPVSCGACGGGLTCTSGGCACVPDPPTKTCAGKNCGTAVNNCGAIVACGASGAASCAASNDVCKADGTCCTPDDAAACSGKCGVTVTNNCGEATTCAGTCPGSGVCTSNHTCCNPTPPSTWCQNRCGATTDNCGQPIMCGGCEGGLTCVQGSCGCVPDPIATTCAGKTCGTATNNCGQSVACGAGGTINCATTNEVCLGSSCCTPEDNATACAGKCNTSVTNNCGQTVNCSATCPNAGVCLGNDTCCTPESDTQACSGQSCGTATNKCGQTVRCPDKCVAPNTCGGGGAGPNACGCTPDPVSTTCKTVACGSTPNNCGQTVACPDTCPAPAVCGGAGAGPNACGVPCGALNQRCCGGFTCNSGLACDVTNNVCNTCYIPLPIAPNCRAIPFENTPYASGQTAGGEAANAADANRCTTWNAGGGAPQYWGSVYLCDKDVCPDIARVGFQTALSAQGTYEVQVVIPGTPPIPPILVADQFMDLAPSGYYEISVNLKGGPQSSVTGGPLELHFTAQTGGTFSWIALAEIVFLQCN